MNQKLRTARSGMVILVAVLCIVCLSLSLVFSAHFAAYAEDVKLEDVKDGESLWLVHYEGCEDGESLWGGIHDSKPIAYIDSNRDANDNYVVKYGTADDKDCFAPYRGIELTLKLNPNYTIDGATLASLYDLEHAEYQGNSAIGESDKSVDMSTSVTLQPLDDSSATEPLVLEKKWMIATLCNTVDFQGTYIVDRVYGVPARCVNVYPVLDNTFVVYDISSISGEIAVFAVRYEESSNGQLQPAYYQAAKGDSGYFVAYEDGDPEKGFAAWNEADTTAAANANLSLINYLIGKLNVLESADETKTYTLTIAALQPDVAQGEIAYAQSSQEYPFNVNPQMLGDDAENDTTFEGNFKYTLPNSVVDYTGDDQWINKIGFALSLKNDNGDIVLSQEDYDIIVDSYDVGRVDLRVIGHRNLTGYHTIKGAIRINPAENSWIKAPSIVTWMYGTYQADNNLIVGVPKYLDNPNDVTFRIVRLVKDRDGNITEETIEALSNIHYYVEEDAENQLTTNWIVTDDVKSELAKLSVGDYRLYASVYGSNNTDSVSVRNYKELAEQSVDFTIFEGINRWKAGAEPSINGWTAGKLSTTEDLMNAESIFGTPILMIYDIEDKLIYSNLPEHANTEFGDINVLKGLKAGRYYLSALVEATENYAELKATVLFDVVPNNLPIWAVILIVAGSLGIVALVFGILHQKGVLQMLTGKVIVSMRTRANVDATLAAIRAAKVAREAQESIAAAKAREAEEAAKAKSEDK